MATTVSLWHAVDTARAALGGLTTAALHWLLCTARQHMLPGRLRHLLRGRASQAGIMSDTGRLSNSKLPSGCNPNNCGWAASQRKVRWPMLAPVCRTVSGKDRIAATGPSLRGGVCVWGGVVLHPLKENAPLCTDRLRSAAGPGSYGTYAPSGRRCRGLRRMRHGAQTTLLILQKVTWLPVSLCDQRAHNNMSSFAWLENIKE